MTASLALSDSASAFLAKHAAAFTVDPVFGCWLWSRVDSHGYGVLWGKDGPRQVHREAYKALVGPIPDGKLLDHLCRRRACFRPDDLDPIDNAENQRRATWRYRARQTTCAKGHPMATCMTTSEGGRICRRCRAESPWRDVA